LYHFSVYIVYNINPIKQSTVLNAYTATFNYQTVNNSFVTSGDKKQMKAKKTNLKIVLVLAKLRICPRTTPMPRSSEAFNFEQNETYHYW